VSYAARLIHDLTLVRVPYDADPGSDDEYGQPPAVPTSSAVRGLVQPKANTREQADTRSAGAAVADHVIFLPLLDLSAADHLLRGSERYEIVGIRRFEFGRSPHLEVDARRVTGALAAAGS
jgi:hypothetical protein